MTLRPGFRSAVLSGPIATSAKGCQVLCSYAERAASRAVIHRSREALVLGLIALVVVGLDQNLLEALIEMALIEDAGKRIGLEPADVIEDAVAAIGRPGSANLMVLLARPLNIGRRSLWDSRQVRVRQASLPVDGLSASTPRAQNTAPPPRRGCVISRSRISSHGS